MCRGDGVPTVKSKPKKKQNKTSKPFSLEVRKPCKEIIAIVYDNSYKRITFSH